MSAVEGKHTLVDDGQHAAVQMRLSRGLRVAGDGDDGTARAVLAEQVRTLAARRDHHDGGREALRGRLHCRDGRGVRGLNWGLYLE